jgi:hypothetical protein
MFMLSCLLYSTSCSYVVFFSLFPVCSVLHIKVLLQDNINNKTQIQEVGTKNCNRIRKMYIRLEIIELEKIRHKIYKRLEK